MSGEENRKHLKQEIETHDEMLSVHDRRISRNENWRLQMMGALKFAAFVIGVSITALGVLITAGVV